MYNETFRLNRFSLFPAAGPCGPPGPATRAGPPAATTVGPAPPPGPPAAGLAAAAALPRLIVPKANVRPILKLTTTELGDVPKFRGTISSPGSGTRLKFPNGVHLIVDSAQLA